MEAVEIANLLDGVRFKFVCKRNYVKCVLLLFCTVLCFKSYFIFSSILVLQTAEYSRSPGGFGDF